VLYPVVFAVALAAAAGWLPAEDDGPLQWLLWIGLTVSLGAAIGSWWVLLVPVGWALVALAARWGFPFENSDPLVGQLFLALVVLAGVPALAAGVGIRRTLRRRRGAML
jgi:hypothetical protein